MTNTIAQNGTAFLQNLCRNICVWNQMYSSNHSREMDLDLNKGNLLWSLLHPSSSINNTENTLDVKQKDALLYIIVVLMFHSFGMVIMLIGYLKRERKELEEERHLQDFLKTPPPTVRAHRGCSSGKLALHAFNAASLITQPNTCKGKVTFV